MWKCRNRLPTIGKETIFEYSAWQPMRVQKSTMFRNLGILIGGSTISEICQGSMGCYVRISKCRTRLPTKLSVRRRFLNVLHGSSCECRNLGCLIILLFPIGGKAISEICKTAIFKHHRISIGGRAISDIAKTALFNNWLLRNGGSMISEVWKRSMLEKKGRWPKRSPVVLSTPQD